MRHDATGRVSVLRREIWHIEPYRPALPVAPPPC
jgi:hypothetical protein